MTAWRLPLIFFCCLVGACAPSVDEETIEATPQELERREYDCKPECRPAYLVKDIVPGLETSDPVDLTDVDGTLYLTTLPFPNPGGVVELWKSDGTPEGTVFIETLFLGSYLGESQYPTAVNGLFFFVAAESGEHDIELWRSDGTPEGTFQLKEINPMGPSYPEWLTNADGTLFFVASSGEGGPDLWKSDGTPEGTVLVKDINPGGFGGVSILGALGGMLLLSASDDTGTRLWRSDGTPQGTVPLADIVPDLYVTAVADGKFFFVADDGLHGAEPWVSDGTSGGTRLVEDIRPGPEGSSPLSFVSVGREVFFTADDGVHGQELWKTSGSSGSTRLVEDIHPGPANAFFSDYTQVLATANGKVFFVADDGRHGREVWVSQGRSRNTRLVEDLTPGTASSFPGYPTALVGVGKGVLFSIPNATYGQELWRSDGTPRGTFFFQDIAPGPSASSPSWFTESGDRAFFVADDGVHGRELWALPLESLGNCFKPRPDRP
ncbi:Flagellar hook-length control protein FliK [Cystobacter fuscus DSM 2262]|uniref:Flagellar hook-length control protein FliK n=1 Tax=Cystobacter fuscus (strain ATCC 25194 / DSM 2262 / NBRC 100088 / M29) TaxID=1242864 RepID=S9QEE3_CYSF2|nr:ELWxxDGT repeat protein [Cystobacter fuscus]EPX59679.1 Flagellar hook-length control protein FliK [Cystobacter fuscus DSM 2262]